MAKHGSYTPEKVSFPSHGETVVGVVYRPKGAGGGPPSRSPKDESHELGNHRHAADACREG